MLPEEETLAHVFIGATLAATSVGITAQVTKMDLKVENGKVLAYRTKLALSFKYEE